MRCKCSDTAVRRSGSSSRRYESSRNAANVEELRDSGSTQGKAQALAFSESRLTRACMASRFRARFRFASSTGLSCPLRTRAYSGCELRPPRGMATMRKTLMLRDDGGKGGGRPSIPRNVLGDRLEVCSINPMTGFYRDGCCDTGPEDIGSHTVCAVMTADFLEFSKSRGNDLSTRPCISTAPGSRATQGGIRPKCRHPSF